MAAAPSPPSSPLFSASSLVLVFAAPFDRQQSQPLRLTNVSSTQAVAFKVRTTAPKRFAVRPNQGLLPPNGSEELTVILHGGAEHEAAINKMTEKRQQKDRFLVVGVLCDPSTVSGPESLSQIFSSEPAPNLRKGLKLKVRYTFDNLSSNPATSAPAVPPSPVTSSITSPAPSPAPASKDLAPPTVNPLRSSATARAPSPPRIKPVAPTEAARPPPLTLSLLQTQVLKAKAGEEMLAEANAAAAAKQTNQEKFLTSMMAKDSVLETQMANPERYALLFEERRKLQQKLEDLAIKYREAVAERDKLSGIVRELRAKQPKVATSRSDSSGMIIIVVLLVALLAYIIGRWK